MLLGMVCSVVLAQTAPISIEWHGYIQNRLYANPGSSARFAVERVSLSATAKMEGDRTAYVELYENPNVPSAAEQYRTYLESAYFETPLKVGRLRIGKGRQQNFGMIPAYANRKLTNYGVVAEAFTQDRITGVQWMYKQNCIDAGISVFNDLRLGTRSVGDFPGVLSADVVPHWAERDVPSTMSGELGVSAKFGMVTPIYSWHISGMTGGLNANNLSDINTAYDEESTNQDHSKYGIDASYTNGKIYAGVEGYRAKYSFLTVEGFNATAGYVFADGHKVFAKYGKINNNKPVNADLKTWEPKQWMFGAVHPITKNIWVEANYEINEENGGNIDNDILFVELFTGF